MDKRYYYDCAIKAAYMAKYHGMKFKSSRGQNLYFDGGADFRAEFDGGIYVGCKYRIHPDSVALLQPMVGDLLLMEDNYFGAGRPCIVVKRIRQTDVNGNVGPFYDYDDPESIEEDGEDWIIGGHDAFTIIQRNGLPFFWPEVDNG